MKTAGVILWIIDIMFLCAGGFLFLMKDSYQSNFQVPTKIKEVK